MSSKRILIKLSGEALQDQENNSIFKPETLFNISTQIKTLVEQEYEIGVVIGGGNIWRGKLSNDLKISQEHGDYMGMLSTVINSIAITNMLREEYKIETNLINSLEVVIPDNYIPYDPATVEQYFKKGVVNIFAGGTGKPFFSTDTSVARKTLASGAKQILIAKFGTDGIYDKDPNKYDDAEFISELSYQEAIDRKLQVMDKTAMEELKDTNVVVSVFDMNVKDSIVKSLTDKNFKKTTMKK